MKKVVWGCLNITISKLPDSAVVLSIDFMQSANTYPLEHVYSRGSPLDLSKCVLITRQESQCI